MKHSQIIINILKNKNISVYKLSKETGISESLFSKWKKNPTSEISSSNLAKIADYLDCSVDYLLGRVDTPNGIYSISNQNSTINGTQANVIHNISNTTEKTEHKDEMTKELTKRFNELSFDKKLDVFNYIKQL